MCAVLCAIKRTLMSGDYWLHDPCRMIHDTDSAVSDHQQLKALPLYQSRVTGMTREQGDRIPRHWLARELRQPVP